jgi:DNA repair exonuclease SbcCD ATPase subunit
MQRRTLRPLDTLPAKDREALYKAADTAYKNYHYVSQTTRLLKKEKKERGVNEVLTKKLKEIDEKAAKIHEQNKLYLDMMSQKSKRIDDKQATVMLYERKRKQEEEKLRKELDTITIKDEELKKLREEHRIQEDQLSRIEQKIKDYTIYKDFLEQVVSVSEDFESIPALIARYNTLKRSIINIESTLRNLEEQTHREKEESARLLKLKKDELAVNAGHLHNLENDIEKITTDLANAEMKREEIRRERIISKGVAVKVLLSIKNLYEKAMNTKNQFKSTPEQTKEVVDLPSMLDAIQKRFEDLKKITEDVEDTKKEDKKAKKRERLQSESPAKNFSPKETAKTMNHASNAISISSRSQSVIK